MQSERLKVTVKHAYENVPFYRRKLDEAKIKPSDIRSIDDLPKLPLTTKEEIQESPLRDHVAANVDLNRCVKLTTSGSSGLPLTVLGDGRTADFSRALWTRAYVANGLRITDKMAFIWNPLTFRKNKGVSRLLSRKFISVFEDVKQQLKILEDYQPNVIRSYPSSLALLAAASRNRENRVRPRLVFTGAELLNARDRLDIESAFQCDVLDYYGCIEFSLLMWECTRHMGYHMNIDNVAIEFLKNGEVVDPGEEGEIVCTSLHSYVMPLIRYRLGDIGIPIEGRCSCGRTLPLMKVLRGRSDDLLTALDGKLVFASAFFYDLLYSLSGHLEGIKQFRVIQEKRDRLLVQLVTKKGVSYDNVVLERATKYIQSFLGEGMQVEFQFLDEIKRDPTGKLRIFVSHIQRDSIS